MFCSSLANHTSTNFKIFLSWKLDRLQNSPYFCVFKYARAVKQKVWNEAENRERDWGETLRARKTLTPRFTALLILRKKPTVWQSKNWTNLLNLPIPLNWHFKREKPFLVSIFIAKQELFTRTLSFVYKTSRLVRIALLISNLNKEFFFFLRKVIAPKGISPRRRNREEAL